jgi:hypothetical protein
VTSIPHRCARARGLLALGAALVAWPGGVAGQGGAPEAPRGTVHTASLDADFTVAPGFAHIRIDYELNGLEPGDLVPVSVLDFGDARAQDFLVGASGAPASLAETHGAARRGAWPVEVGADGRTLLRVEYRVPRTGEDGGGRIVSHLPLVSVDRAPEAARTGLFQGRVRVPAEWAVTEGFPTGLALGDEPDVYAVALSVVPSVVTLRARADGRWGLALPLVLDLVALGVLLVTAVAGWRHMREPLT